MNQEQIDKMKFQYMVSQQTIEVLEYIHETFAAALVANGDANLSDDQLDQYIEQHFSEIEGFFDLLWYYTRSIAIAEEGDEPSDFDLAARRFIKKVFGDILKHQPEEPSLRLVD